MYTWHKLDGSYRQSWNERCLIYDQVEKAQKGLFWEPDWAAEWWAMIGYLYGCLVDQRQPDLPEFLGKCDEGFESLFYET